MRTAADSVNISGVRLERGQHRAERFGRHAADPNHLNLHRGGVPRVAARRQHAHGMEPFQSALGRAARVRRRDPIVQPVHRDAVAARKRRRRLATPPSRRHDTLPLVLAPPPLGREPLHVTIHRVHHCSFRLS